MDEAVVAAAVGRKVSVVLFAYLLHSATGIRPVVVLLLASAARELGFGEV